MVSSAFLIGEGVNINGLASAGRTGTTNFTAYISPYLVVRNGGEYTKHIYMGSQRITSKVGNSGIFASSPVTTTELQAKYTAQTAKIKERFDSLGVTYKGMSQSGGLVSSNPVATASSYFYHSDHLGSSSLITDQSGDIVQHLEYVPFGETFIDERRSQSSWTTPYLFSGKERDEETGLLYFGARYQDSKYGIWYSVNPLAEKKPWVSSYVYCMNNPINMVDPDGRDEVFSKSGLHIKHINNSTNNVYINDNKQRLLSSYNYSWNWDNRMMFSNVETTIANSNGIYGQVGIEDYNSAIVGDAFAVTDPSSKKISICVNQRGHLTNEQNNYYNIVNAYIHEKDHQRNIGIIKDRGLLEVSAIIAQVSDQSFARTTDNFQQATLQCAVKNINKALKARVTSTTVGEKIKTLNSYFLGIGVITYDQKANNVTYTLSLSSAEVVGKKKK